MRSSLRLAAVLALLGTAGCGPTWSYSDVKPASGAQAPGAGSTTAGSTTSLIPVRAPTSPGSITLTEGDIADRAYSVLADLEVTVNKTTIFNSDPTRGQIDERLRQEAAKLGADAVIQVRYGTVGIGLMSWGSLDGRGRAVAFSK